MEFSAEDATRTSLDVLLRFAEAVVAAGATTVNLPDTVGYTTPAEMADLIGKVSKALAGRAVVSVHCHDDLGLAVANSLAGVQAGARQIECTMNGIGERAGNCSLEEVVMAMAVRKDIYAYQTGIRTEKLYPTSRQLAELIGFDPQPNKAIVGKNAFAHEAGIHQDGFLKERTTYEIMDPHSVGVPSSRLVLGKHSGRHALVDRCQHLGFSLTPPQIEILYRQFISLCDHKKWVADEEIAALARGRPGHRRGLTVCAVCSAHDDVRGGRRPAGGRAAAAGGDDAAPDLRGDPRSATRGRGPRPFRVGGASGTGWAPVEVMDVPGPPPAAGRRAAEGGARRRRAEEVRRGGGRARRGRRRRQRAGRRRADHRRAGRHLPLPGHGGAEGGLEGRARSR